MFKLTLPYAVAIFIILLLAGITIEQISRVGLIIIILYILSPYTNTNNNSKQ